MVTQAQRLVLPLTHSQPVSKLLSTGVMDQRAQGDAVNVMKPNPIYLKHVSAWKWVSPLISIPSLIADHLTTVTFSKLQNQDSLHTTKITSGRHN